MMIQGHESSVNHNAKSYEEINKWIEDNKGEELCQLDVAAAAVPDAHDLNQLEAEGVEPLLESETRHSQHGTDSHASLTQVHRCRL